MLWHPKNFKPAKNPQFVPPGWQLGTIEGKRVAIAPPEKGRKRGKVTTYNQYLNAQARESGFKSHSEYRAFAKKQKVTLAYFRKGQGGAPPAVLSLGSETLKLFREGLFGPDRRNTAPGSNLATFLEAIGWRPKGATFDVGDTPSG